MQTLSRHPIRPALLLATPGLIRIRWRLARAMLAALLLCSGQAMAQLMVYPTRIVLDNDQRSAQVEIINNSNKTTVYRISLVNRRMDAFGAFTTVQTAQPGEQFLGDMVRYSPRRVSLAPGASQIIRVMVRKPAEFATGEYRSHLLFAEQEDPAAPPPAASSPSGQIGVTLTALVGVSIPLIVRQGATTAAVSLEKLALEPPANGASPVLSLQMNRTGTRSVHGDVAVDYLPADGAAAIAVARAAGVAVYTPNLLRQLRLPLQWPAGAMRNAGTLHVSYREPPERGGALLAEASLPVR